MKIVEQNIIQMVGQAIFTNEDVHFKIMVKGREMSTPSNRKVQSQEFAHHSHTVELERQDSVETPLMPEV